MKSLISLFTVCLALSVNAQKIITIDGDVAWVFGCDTIVKASQGIALMNEKSFHKTSITAGKNHMVFDLISMTITNDAIHKQDTIHEVFCMENLTIKGDTICFYCDAISRGEEKIPFRMYWTLLINPKAESDIVWIAAIERPDQNNYVEGQFVKKSMCKLTVQR